MARTLAIDYGRKRCGLAISDPLGMIANGLATADTPLLIDELKKLHREYGYDTIVIGLPLRMSGEPSAIESYIGALMQEIRKVLPAIGIERYDERFTSKIALQSMIAAGATKKQRREKATVDKVSATLILQEYLNSR